MNSYLVSFNRLIRKVLTNALANLVYEECAESVKNLRITKRRSCAEILHAKIALADAPNVVPTITP